MQHGCNKKPDLHDVIEWLEIEVLKGQMWRERQRQADYEIPAPDPTLPLTPFAKRLREYAASFGPRLCPECQRPLSPSVARGGSAKTVKFGSDVEPTINPPRLDYAEVIIAALKDGTHKWRGQGRQRDTRKVKVQKAAVAGWARERRAELRRQLAQSDLDRGIKLGVGSRLNLDERAAKQAAKEGATYALDRYGIRAKPNTVRRWMQTSAETLYAEGASDVG
jgi:hypothetical protein